MKITLILLSTLLFLFGCSDRDSDEVAKQVNYYFSSEPKTCAFIFYNVEGAPTLKLEDRDLNHRFDDQNIILTSSSIDFGWTSEDRSGFRPYNYYKSDSSKITDEEEIPKEFTGGVTVDNIDRDYTVIHFNDKEECFSDDSTEDFNIFSELVKSIYIK